MMKMAQNESENRLNKTVPFMIVLFFTMFLGLIYVSFSLFNAPPGIVVTGRITDENGNAVQGATVVARIGLDMEGKPVQSRNNGEFEVAAAASDWGKGAPSFTVTKQGYREYWGYFEPWKWGARKFQVLVTLQKRAVADDKHNDASKLKQQVWINK